MSLLRIKFQYQELTEEDIIGEEFELIESISSSNELRYGGCEAKAVTFTAVFSQTLKESKGKSFGLTYYDKNYGAFYIDSIKVSDNRDAITVTAYDYLYVMMNTDISYWFNKTKLTGPASDTFGGMWRDLFEDVLHYDYEDITLVTDHLTIPEPDEANEKISAGQFMKIICELNAVFGYIDGDKRRFAFKKVKSAIDKYIYPSSSLFPSENLYPYSDIYTYAPSDGHADIYYIFRYEDYTVRKIDAVGVQSGNGIQYYPVPGTQSYFETKNRYVIKSNQFTKYLDYGTSITCAAAMLNHIDGPSYRPIVELVIDHDNTLEVGANITVQSIWGDVVNSIILSKTTKGIYGAKDYISSNGTEVYNN